jgi:hypothetical protein
MPFLWLAVPTRPDGSGDCGFIEPRLRRAAVVRGMGTGQTHQQVAGQPAASSKKQAEAAVAGDDAG